MKRRNILALVMTVVAIAFFLCGHLSAGSVDEEEAQRRGVPVQQVILENENAALKLQITEKDKEIAALKQQVQSLSTGQAVVTENKNAAQTQPSMNTKSVVVTSQQFKLLPIFTKKFTKNAGPINYSATGTWAADGTPLEFTRTELNAVGYVSAVNVVQIIDETSALVEIGLVDPSTGVSPSMNGGPEITRTVLIEGISTTGQAENNPWSIKSYFKIVSTKKIDEKTYFVAWPIVRANAK